MPTLPVPRLGANRGYLGPEYYGCCGTGRRPLILHCGYSRRYIVGPELAIDVGLRSKIMANPSRRIWRIDRDTVYAFRSRGAAVAKWRELCAEVIRYNDETRAAAKRDLEAARKGDMGALLRLGDL